MQNIKFHILSFISSIIFAYSLSGFFISMITSSFNKISIHPMELPNYKKKKFENKITYNVESILQSGLFRVDNDTGNDNMSSPDGNIEDLRLMGTVTGPSSIARAMILKKGEKLSEIFGLWKDVYGYKLVAINSSNVKLKKGSDTYTLDLYEKKSFTQKPGTGTKPGTIKKQISKSEIQQKVLNNLDNAMKGLRAGPNRKNGEIDGYKLIRVRPYNILYKYGIRSGDILKRVNGKKIDSTEKLYTMWQGIKDQTSLNVEIDRNGQILTYEINITD